MSEETNPVIDRNAVASLGPVVLTGRSVHGLGIAVAIMACVSILGGVAVCFTDIGKPNPSWPVGLMLVLIGLFCLGYCLFAVDYWIIDWFLHENGVRTLRFGKERILHYESIDELTIRSMRVFTYGVCTGEFYHVKFVSNDLPAKPIQFKHTRRPQTISGDDLNEPDQVASIFDRIATMLAHRLDQTLKRGEAIRWTDGLLIRHDGVEMRGRSGQPVLLEWSFLVRLELFQGTFQLWTAASQAPIIKEPTHTPNCMPCVKLVLLRIEAAGAMAENMNSEPQR